MSNLNGQFLPNSFQAEVLVMRDYYPFGMETPGQVYVASEYRYGFQGQERVNEIQGAGMSYNYECRMQDVRLGRFLSVDPLSPEYPWNSPYAFSENRVVDGIEVEGLERLSINSPTYAKLVKEALAMKTTNSTELRKQIATLNNIYLRALKDEENGANVFTINCEARFQGSYSVSSVGDGVFYEISKQIKQPSYFENRTKEGDKLAGSFDGSNVGDIASDHMSLSISGSAIVGVGGSITLSVGWVKGDGFGASFTGSLGFGLDVGVTPGITIGNYDGSLNDATASWAGLMGDGHQVGGGLGPISLSQGVGLSRDQKTGLLARNGWESYTLGIQALGSGDAGILSGSSQTSKTWPLLGTGNK